MGSLDTSVPHDVEIRFKGVFFVSLPMEWKTDTSSPPLGLVTGEDAITLNRKFQVEQGHHIFRGYNSRGITTPTPAHGHDGGPASGSISGSPVGSLCILCEVCISLGVRDLDATARSGAGHLGDDIAVHGSRASGTAKATSDIDIDIAIRVSPEKFDELIKARFGTPNPGSAKERTMLHAISTGKIQAGEAGLRGLRKQLANEAGMPVDISVIQVGGQFDKGPYIPLRQ